MWQNEFVQFLNDDFAAMKTRNPKVSIRSYAKKIGLSPGSLSDVMKKKGQWTLSPVRAAAILERLNVKQSVKNRLLVKMGQPVQHASRELSGSEYDILTDWTYYPILFSYDLPAPFCNQENIAERLGVTLDKVRSVTEDLLTRGLLVKSPTGELQRPEQFVRTSDGPPSDTIRTYHRVNLDLAKRALEEIPTNRRDFTSLTFAGSQNRLEELRKEIRNLYEKASALADGDQSNDQVFRMSVQLFPMEFTK